MTPLLWFLASLALIALAALLAVGLAAVAAAIGDGDHREREERIVADMRDHGARWGDGDHDPGELLYEPPAPVRIHPQREAP